MQLLPPLSSWALRTASCRGCRRCSDRGSLSASARSCRRHRGHWRRSACCRLHSRAGRCRGRWRHRWRSGWSSYAGGLGDLHDAGRRGASVGRSGWSCTRQGLASSDGLPPKDATVGVGACDCQGAEGLWEPVR